ncbi:MAG: hypothetical protein DRN17_07170 [Thermoplasmata archaeon]|nr:MAG: hypothetical protein DRN17_07170 [Thermoplasmata archaeon]
MLDISYMIGSVVDAIVSVIGTVMSILAENVETIALVMAMGLVVGAVTEFGKSAFSSIRDMMLLEEYSEE